MDKKTFFDELTQKLKSKGIGDNEIRKQLDQFDTYFSALSEDALRQELNQLSDVDQVADQICDVIGKPSSSEMSDILPPETFDDASDNDIGELELFDAANSFPEIPDPDPIEESTQREETDSDFQKRRAAKRPGGKSASYGNRPEGEKEDVKTYSEKKGGENGATIFMDPVSITAPKRKRSVPGKPIEEKKDSGKAVSRQKTLSDPIRFSELDNVVPLDQKNVIIFWIVFALTLPITLALLLGIIGIFAALFLLMAGIIAGCLISLVAIAAGGTGYSLLGIIYGILKFGSARAESLYEIGNAILVGGICLLSGVLLYNLAIRLIPFLLKYLGSFFRYVTKKLIKLFKFIKRECTGR